VPTQGGQGPRRVGMPRVQSSPEVNILQRPELQRGVQQYAGVRQAHVLPAMAEGLHATLTTGDIREDPRSGMPLTFASTKELQTDGANPAYRMFINPASSTRVVVLRRFHAYSEETAAGPIASYIYYANASASVTALATTGGTRTNFVWNSTGTQPVIPYDNAIPASTNAGWGTTNIVGVLASYIWRAPWTGTVGTFSSEVLENFNVTSGPRIVLFPGSQIAFGIADATASAYFNMWWDEYPLT